MIQLPGRTGRILSQNRLPPNPGGDWSETLTTENKTPCRLRWLAAEQLHANMEADLSYFSVSRPQWLRSSPAACRQTRQNFLYEQRAAARVKTHAWTERGSSTARRLTLKGTTRPQGRSPRYRRAAGSSPRCAHRRFGRAVACWSSSVSRGGSQQEFLVDEQF